MPLWIGNRERKDEFVAIEIRRILFQPDEFVAIVTSNFSPSDPTVRGATVMMVDLNADRAVQATVHVQKDGHPISVDMAENDLLACVIDFCVEHRIPIAKGAKKSLVRTEKGIAFDMTIRADVGAPAAAPQA